MPLEQAPTILEPVQLSDFDLDTRITPIEVGATVLKKALDKAAKRDRQRPCYLFNDRYELVNAISQGRVHSDMQHECYARVARLPTRPET